MISNADIIKLKKVFVTKQEFREEIDRSNKYTEKLFLTLVKSIDNLSKELSEFKREMAEFKNEMMDFKNEMMDFRESTNNNLDWLVGAFKKFDEEHTVLTVRYSTISKTIENHETRISTLEKKPS